MRNPLKRKPSRYRKARAALRDMLAKRPVHRRKSHSAAHSHPSEQEIPAHEHGFAGLHWMTAGLFVAAGAEAAFGKRRGDHRADDAVRWAPLVAAPLAGAAQAARAIWPSATTRTAARLVNTAAIAVGAAGLVSSIRASLSEGKYEVDEPATAHERFPSLAPLAFGAVGLLGLLLDSEEAEAAEASPPPPRKPLRRRAVKRIRIRV